MVGLNYAQIVVARGAVVDRGQIGREDTAALARLCAAGVVERVTTAAEDVYVLRQVLTNDLQGFKIRESQQEGTDMVETFRHMSTPAAKVGKFAVTRRLNHMVDFLHEWDETYHASFTGVGGAMVFDSEEAAAEAAVEVAKLIPYCTIALGAGEPPTAFVYGFVVLA